MFDIRDLRLKKGISQIELAKNIGVTTRTIQHWEKGTKNITIDKLERINSFFGLNMNIYNQNEQRKNLLLVNEEKSEYKIKNESQIKKLEKKLKLQEDQITNYKKLVASLQKQTEKKIK